MGAIGRGVIGRQERFPESALPRPEALGYAIRQVRTERGLSQEDAALACGIDRAYFGHIERATKNPTMRTIWKLADALDVPASDLLRRAEALANRKG